MRWDYGGVGDELRLLVEQRADAEQGRKGLYGRGCVVTGVDGIQLGDRGAACPPEDSEEARELAGAGLKPMPS